MPAGRPCNTASVQPPPPELTNWTPVWLWSGAVLVGFVAEWRFRRGWGKSTQWWFHHPGRVEPLVRLGYAMRPINVSFSMSLVGFLLFHVFVALGTDALGVAALAAWVVSVSAALWSGKEYLRPSEWRRTPQWIHELNEQVAAEESYHVARSTQ